MGVNEDPAPVSQQNARILLVVSVAILMIAGEPPAFAEDLNLNDKVVVIRPSFACETKEDAQLIDAFTQSSIRSGEIYGILIKKVKCWELQSGRLGQIAKSQYEDYICVSAMNAPTEVPTCTWTAVSNLTTVKERPE